MNLRNFGTGTKLALSFGLVNLLTLAIVLVSFNSLNKIELSTKNYNVVLKAQKDFLIANSFLESYLNEKDSSQYVNCSIYLDSAFLSFVVLKPGVDRKELPLIDELFVNLRHYKELMQQNHDAIETQKKIYNDRRKMRIIFTDIIQKYNISRHNEIVYNFNWARLYAVYLLSSNDRFYYNEVEKYIDLALDEANKINKQPVIKALEDYMLSVKENYDLALKIRDAKNAQIVLGNVILEKSGIMINHIDLYQEKVRKSSKISMLVFSVISIVISIVISRFVVLYMSKKQHIIEVKNMELLKQAKAMGKINTLLEERQQQIEEQSEELMAQRDQLSQLNATKDKLFTVLAHDLRNPFNSIIGFSDLLLSNLRIYSPEQINSQLTIIRNSSQYAFDLLDNLLQWSRSQRGILSFEPKILNITEHIEIELNCLRQQALRKKITIELKIEGKEKSIEADPNLIKTVIRNLVCNAIKFSKRESKIIITLHFNEDNFVLEVKDHGIGMMKGVKDQLFKIAGNISSAGTDGEKGTGLGLLLCSDFIEKHKGRIWVESEVDVGSTFYFSIPYVQG
jgi:signal transduction histidine kinase